VAAPGDLRLDHHRADRDLRPRLRLRVNLEAPTAELVCAA
jgi:hypothetical protein